MNVLEKIKEFCKNTTDSMLSLEPITGDSESLVKLRLPGTTTLIGVFCVLIHSTRSQAETIRWIRNCRFWDSIPKKPKISTRWKKTT